jgi:hypothetical protein
MPQSALIQTQELARYPPRQRSSSHGILCGLRERHGKESGLRAKYVGEYLRNEPIVLNVEAISTHQQQRDGHFSL